MTREQYELQKRIDRVRAYQEAIEPFVRMKVDVLSRACPKITIYPDGRTETEYPEWVNTQLAAYDVFIKSIAESYGDHD